MTLIGYDRRGKEREEMRGEVSKFTCHIFSPSVSLRGATIKHSS